jgi:predicted RNA-binding Zn-ribbon protein involved in translation (DUF1610 family)
MRVLTDAARRGAVHAPLMETTSLQGLRNLVNVKAHAPCPMCGQDVWAGGDRLTQIESIEAMPFVCTNCGFVRLHAIQPLETLDD